MKSLLILLCLFPFLTESFRAQTVWSLKKDKDGIRVYTATADDSRFKMVKVECITAGSPEQLAVILLHAENLPGWVFATKSAYVARRLGPSEIYYYSEVNIPWPLSNRDMVIDLVVSQDPVTKIMTIHADNIDKILPEKAGKVRVTLSHAVWTVIPLPENKIKIIYSIRINPGGGIPAWMVNMFIAKAPYESFRKLTAMIPKQPYREVKLAFQKK